ncbi:hypothetical protein SEA_CAMERICO_97 [Gordonia phage Camerico]|nr:hypothetical protein SEA_CAMERICO_97 [Gordonia phage Camerico]
MKTFSKFVPGTLTTGVAYSSRDGINVVMFEPTGGDNHHYPRPRHGTVVENIRRRVRETFVNRPGVNGAPSLAEKYPDFSVTVNPDYVVKGQYRYTVWSHPLNVPTPENVIIYGWRWRDRYNPYFTYAIYADGELIHRETQMQYGYGDQYVYVAFDKYRELIDIGESDDIPPWKYFQRNNIKLTYKAFDCKRRADMTEQTQFMSED